MHTIEATVDLLLDLLADTGRPKVQLKLPHILS